jgi:GNAT superfamily N-acetyltransferase
VAPLTGNVTALQLTLADVDLALLAHIDARFAEAGLTLHSLGELQRREPGWLALFTNLDNGTRAGRADPLVPRSVEDMQARLAELALDPDACFVAIADGHWVGYTVLDTAHSDPTVLRQSWTGVLPAWRRQGIASGLKLRAIRYALAHGYQAVRTEARSANEASVGLNRRLGFLPVAG